MGTGSGDRFLASVVVNSLVFSRRRSAGWRASPSTRSIRAVGSTTLDRRLDGMLNTLVYSVPKKNAPGLGIHLTPTVDRNILIGPDAEYLEDPDDVSCTATGLLGLRTRAEAHARDPHDGLHQEFLRHTGEADAALGGATRISW